MLGPDFFLWASNFFIKDPRSTSTVGWHQDSYYWPMAPHNSVTEKSPMPGISRSMMYRFKVAMSFTLGVAVRSPIMHPQRHPAKFIVLYEPKGNL